MARARFAVLGHPVGHSLSPAMHAANFKALGFDGEYTAIDVDPADLAPTIARLAAGGFSGFNCTIPHKETVIPLLSRLSPSARLCGAVNTVKIGPGGEMTGCNTDCAGFRLALEDAGMAIAGRRVAILGAGGAARAAAVACIGGKCKSVAIANRTRERAERLARALKNYAAENNAAISPCGGLDDPDTVQAVLDADIVVNATPVGLAEGDPPAFPGEMLRGAWQLVFDLAPVARETATVSEAKRSGTAAIGGLGMLVHQGAEAFRIWTGLAPDLAAMRSAVGFR